MATLNWIGKDKVINHHLDVPFKTLRHKYTFKDGDTLTDGTRSENKIIHGDNLEALKALLPEYEGKIKCIYIDPPYNTGNEGWVYNDNVNHPKIKKWLGEVVGKEGEDLSRHDKWLCMMYPRLKLLHQLLAEDGVIFVSIDNIEQHLLKIILDEIFGNSNFVSDFIWKSRQNVDSRSLNGVSNDHEYIFVYRKSDKFNRLKGRLIDTNKYKNPDNDPRGSWMSSSIDGLATIDSRPNLHYVITNPQTGKQYSPNPANGWRYQRSTVQKLIEENRIIWPKNDNSKPRVKRYLNEVNSVYTGTSSLINTFYTVEGTRELREIMGGETLKFPKPSSLISFLIDQILDKKSIVLDSFAGSGTTAQAVLKLNKEDGGNRKFILVEMEDYAESITAERVKRVIKGYGDGKKSVEGTGGNFEFLDLGNPLFNEEGYLNEDQPVEDIRKYVYFSETRTSIGYSERPKNQYYLGKKSRTAYYFYYKKDGTTTLNLDFVSTIEIKADQYVVYADKCSLSEKFMQENKIIFKKIPRDINRI